MHSELYLLKPTHYNSFGRSILQSAKLIYPLVFVQHWFIQPLVSLFNLTMTYISWYIPIFSQNSLGPFSLVTTMWARLIKFLLVAIQALSVHGQYGNMTEEEFHAYNAGRRISIGSVCQSTVHTAYYSLKLSFIDTLWRLRNPRFLWPIAVPSSSKSLLHAIVFRPISPRPTFLFNSETNFVNDS